jgi:hypothetical protein
MLNEQVVLCTNDMGSNHVHLGENKNEKDTYKYKTNTFGLNLKMYMWVT